MKILLLILLITGCATCPVTKCECIQLDKESTDNMINCVIEENGGWNCYDHKGQPLNLPPGTKMIGKIEPECYYNTGLWICGKSVRPFHWMDY